MSDNTILEVAQAGRSLGLMSFMTPHGGCHWAWWIASVGATHHKGRCLLTKNDYTNDMFKRCRQE